VEDVAVSRWVSAEPNDTLGWWAHAAEDVDRDGLPDLLVLTRGITDVGVLALIPGREGGYPRENALLDSPWIAYDAMSLSEVAAVPDLDGDGFLDVLAVQYHGAEWFSGATLAGCAGCAEARGVVFPEVGDLLFYEAAPSPDGGDLDGDGIHELVLVSVDRERVTEQGSCISWVDGATVGAGVAMLVDETTRACKSSAYDVGTGLRSSSDIDGDGLPDPVWDYDDYLEGTQLCTALTTRLAPGARVELMDASWCLGGNLGAVGDFSGDGVPDFIGAAAALPDDVPNCGAIPMMLGFEIPFDDASKW
jgi:hypothetical protein